MLIRWSQKSLKEFKNVDRSHTNGIFHRVRPGKSYKQHKEHWYISCRTLITFTALAEASRRSKVTILLRYFPIKSTYIGFVQNIIQLPNILINKTDGYRDGQKHDHKLLTINLTREPKKKITTRYQTHSLNQCLVDSCSLPWHLRSASYLHEPLLHRALSLQLQI